MTDKETSPTQTVFPIFIKDQEFKLFYSVEALWAFEDATGVDLLKPDARALTEEGRKEMLAEANSRNLRDRMQDTGALLWAGLLFHHPDLKLEYVKDMLKGSTIKEWLAVQAAVNQAYQASLPKFEATEESPDPLAQSD